MREPVLEGKRASSLLRHHRYFPHLKLPVAGNAKVQMVNCRMVRWVILCGAATYSAFSEIAL